uniref:Uncharacterized protein n=1 Tax=Arundo donax TaxID=35708 RepID=A0A0A9EKA1_ARUDO
MSAGGVQECAS